MATTREAPDSLRILLLRDVEIGGASTVADHVESIQRYSRHRVVCVNPRPLRHLGMIDFDHFDVLVVHYSIFGILDSYLPEETRQRIEAFRGLKVQFIQDDYRQVRRIANMAGRLGIDLFYTLYPEKMIERVWRRFSALDAVQIRSTLAGYVPDTLLGRPAIALADRPVDVAYRGRECPYELGQFAQEKVAIGQRFLARAEGSGLRCDIAWREQDRIYGDDWIRFLTSARAVLGTESGASITDFDGEIQAAVEVYLARHPEASFEEVSRELLSAHEENAPIRVISPRAFEAIALRTAMVLFPGEYSGILEPNRHYIPLEKDFSNFDDVLARLRDTDFLEAMVERAYEDVLASGVYSFSAFVRSFDSDVASSWSALPAERRRPGASSDAPGALERIRFLRVRGTAAAVRTFDPLNAPGRLLLALPARLQVLRVAVPLTWGAIKGRFALGRVIRPMKRGRVRTLLRKVIGDDSLPRLDCVLSILKIGDWPSYLGVRFHVRLHTGEAVEGEVDPAIVRELVRRKNVREIHLVGDGVSASNESISAVAFPPLLLERHADEVAELVGESLEASRGRVLVDA